MSQDNVEVVRKPLRVRERSSRTLDQRLALRFPRLVDAYARLFGRLPPSSRLRQAFMWRNARLSVEAINRRDLDSLLMGHYHPDFEVHPQRGLVEAGFAEPCYRGPAGYREWVSSWFEAWGADMRVEPVELIDLGERIVLLAELRLRGQASGVAFTGEFASVVTLKHGRALRDEGYVNHAEALEAVGLRE
jgi:hypothetical protein